MSESNDKKITWAIWNFPESVKNKFIGMAKQQGMTASECLEYVICKWLRDERKKNNDG